MGDAEGAGGGIDLGKAGVRQGRRRGPGQGWGEGMSRGGEGWRYAAKGSDGGWGMAERRRRAQWWGWGGSQQLQEYKGAELRAVRPSGALPHGESPLNFEQF